MGDRVSPVAEGAELWAGKGRVLFLVEKRENVLHELTQSVIPRRGWGRTHKLSPLSDVRAQDYVL